ncbi:MAG: RluA family pseudouridine synthase [Myxococcales bacterium]|nr:RluA family pseudouridine synthase [Myxococcales bacterium]
MRLDRFLAARFADRSRSFFAKRIRAREVRDEQGQVLSCSHRVIEGDCLSLHIPGMVPDGPPPPFPEVLFDDAGVVAVNKPPGLLCHPAGTQFTWAVVSLAKQRYPSDDVDLVHRLDRDTSGVLLLTRCSEVNRHLKAQVKAGTVHKEYLAIVKGRVPWDRRLIEAPIGPAGGVIRIQMGVRASGQPARTECHVVARQEGLSLVRCVLHTGRTHQIRVHLDHVGHPILGDRMYGVPPSVFLSVLDEGVTEATVRVSGAPRQALHASITRVRLPGGRTVEMRAPWAPDLARWWEQPECLPYDGAFAR